MNFAIGDRVVSIMNDCPGLEKGECGTVVAFDYWDEPIVEWDDYNPDRHDSDGLVKSYHGWFIHSSNIRLIEPEDLGDLSGTVRMEIDKFLFE